MSGPLDGVTVVAIEQALSAPFGTRQLADLGARVIKIERVGEGDFARRYDNEVRGMACHFVWANRSKESLALDFTKPAGRAILDELIATSDVVIQNLAPGTAARLGLSAKQLAAAHPRLIACDVTGYGEGGPYEGRRAYDLIVQAETAAIATTGWPDAPAKPGVAIADLAAGLYAFSSVLAALYEREKTGKGRAISVSMFDATTELMGYSVYYTSNTGKRHEPVGMRHPTLSPYEAFDTADGARVVLGVQNDREWQRLVAEVLERPELAADPRYATTTARVAHREEVTAACAEAIGRMTLDEAITALDAAGVACGRFSRTDDLVAHPQLSERERWRDVDSPVGPVRSLLPPPVSEGWEPRMDRIPAVGENTRAILHGLGRSDAQIDELADQGVIGVDPTG